MKDAGIVAEIIGTRERAGREEKEQRFVDNVVSRNAFFFLFPFLERLFDCARSSSEQDCLVGEPQYAHGDMKHSLTSGISYETLPEPNFLFFFFFYDASDPLLSDLMKCIAC